MVQRDHDVTIAEERYRNLVNQLRESEALRQEQMRQQTQQQEQLAQLQQQLAQLTLQQQSIQQFPQKPAVFTAQVDPPPPVQPAVMDTQPLPHELFSPTLPGPTLPPAFQHKVQQPSTRSNLPSS